MPAQALACIENIVARFSFTGLKAEEYIAVLQQAAQRHIRGGTVYDALIAHCALKAGADEIYTWNIRHYEMLGPEIVKRLKTPSLVR